MPLLAVWALLDRREWASGREGTQPSGWDTRFLWAGFFFAGDLALWHWSLLLTSIAASTLEANLAPIIVTLIAWIVWRQRPRPQFLVALALALVGVVLIVSPKFSGSGPHSLIGDLLGIGTAMFYAGYIVVVSRLRTTYSTGIVMFQTTLIFTVLLLPLGLTQKFLPDTLTGWALLAGLGVVVHFFGQGLIAFALAHLPVTYGAIGLYLQPVAAAVYAWLLLGEQLAPIQIAGAIVVLVALGLARPPTS